MVQLSLATKRIRITHNLSFDNTAKHQCLDIEHLSVIPFKSRLSSHLTSPLVIYIHIITIIPILCKYQKEGTNLRLENLIPMA